MKLLTCHIENFGKLSNFSMKFSKGMNVINEHNAWGKSTLAAFLKAMFYGFDSKKDPQAFENERVLYRPWQGGLYGGEVEFEINEKAYRIRRTFGRTEKTDEFRLYDLATNLESQDYSEDIGLEIFELDSASFKRSIYIAQNSCISETSDSINAKLGNFAETMNDMNHFEQADKQLQELLNQLAPDKTTGTITKRKYVIDKLSQELELLKDTKANLTDLTKKEKEVNVQLKKLLVARKSYANILVTASEEREKNAFRKQYDALCKDVEEKEQKKTKLDIIFPEGIPEESEIELQMQNIRKFEEYNSDMRNQAFSEQEKESWEHLNTIFKEEPPMQEDVEDVMGNLSKAERRKEELALEETRIHIYEEKLHEKESEPIAERPTNYKGFFVMGMVMIIIGIVSLLAGKFGGFEQERFTMILIGAVCIFVCGVIVSIIGISIKNKGIAAQNMQIEQLETEIKQLQETIDTLTTKANVIKEEVQSAFSEILEYIKPFGIECEEEEYREKLYDLKMDIGVYERLEVKQREYTLLKSKKKEVREEIRAFEEKFCFDLGKDLTLGIHDLQKKVTEYQLAEQAYTKSLEKKTEFEQMQPKSFWTKEAACPYSLDELNGMIAETDEQIETLKRTLNQYQKQIADLQEQLDICDQKTTELELQQQIQEEETEKYQLMKTTREFLQKAKEKLTSKYMDPVARGFCKYYQMLTGDTETEWMLDTNLNLKVCEYGEMRDTKWLSAGYQDLMGICMRLALTEAMYQQEKPFLIMDDPFVNLDEEKVECGNKLLLSVAKEYQVIYFTCHESRKPE